MFAWLRRLSWKWKLTVLFIVIVMIVMGVIMSGDGQQWMKDKVVAGYNETPEAERRESVWADRFLSLAYFRGYICGDTKAAMQMYQEFLGVVPDDKGRTVFETWKLSGPLCSPDGKMGWGPAHPRAPEAYYHYLELYEVENSSQFTGQKCWQYYTLLYDWMVRSSYHKPNENFKQYWEKVQIMGRKSLFPPPQGIDMSARLAPNVEAAQ